MTKFQLFSLLTANHVHYFNTPFGRGILLSMEREDGSGSRFNVTVLVRAEKYTYFLETVD